MMPKFSDSRCEVKVDRNEISRLKINCACESDSDIHAIP